MITVLGASGFIGSALVKKLKELNRETYAPARDETLTGKALGDVIYCIGVTADFRTRPFDTVEAHVCKLIDVLRNCDFSSLLYLSSTRLYTTSEQDSFNFSPADPNDLYNLSKAMGESVILNCGRSGRVARISNVYGADFASDNFLSSILKQAVAGEKVVLRTAPDSAKDYISIDDVADGLIQIATKGQERIYNLASGVNVSHGELAQWIHELTGAEIEFAPGAPTVKFPSIDIRLMREQFQFAPHSILEDLPSLVRLYEGNRQAQ